MSIVRLCLSIFVGVVFTLTACNESAIVYPLDDAPRVPNSQGTHLRLMAGETLRSMRMDDDEMLVYVSSDDTLVFQTTAVLKGGEWILATPYTLSTPVTITCVYPGKGLVQDDGQILIRERERKDVLTYRAKADVHNSTLSVHFSHLLSRVKVLYDLSGFPGGSMINEVSLWTAYPYGWFNLHRGSLWRHENFESGRIVDQVNKQWNEGVYAHEFYVLPGEKGGVIPVSITIDGKDYKSTLQDVKRNWEAGCEYVYRLQPLYRYAPTPLTSEDRSYSAVTPLGIETGGDRDFSSTTTDAYWRTIDNNSARIFPLWVDNLTPTAQKFDVVLRFLDEQNTVVCQSPIYSGFETKRAGDYVGFQLPMYVSVPRTGRYRYELLVRPTDTDKWYVTQEKDIDSPADRWITIVDNIGIYSAGIRMTAESALAGKSLISTIKYDTPYTFVVYLNSYLSEEKEVTLRLYYRRDPIADGHSLYTQETHRWMDEVGRVKVTVPSGVCTPVEIPYVLRERRMIPGRFPSHLCLTIDMGDGVESPLLSDDNLVYKKACRLKDYTLFEGGERRPILAGDIVSNYGVNNKAYVEAE